MLAPKYDQAVFAHVPEVEAVVNPGRRQLERYIEDRFACREPEYQVQAHTLRSVELLYTRLKRLRA